jgi:hypothetical protein
VVDSILGNALRVFLCWGALEALARAASSRRPLPGAEPRESAVEMVWRMQQGSRGLLEALGQVAHASATSARRLLHHPSCYV